jgi:hypothetical protein
VVSSILLDWGDAVSVRVRQGVVILSGELPSKELNAVVLRLAAADQVTVNVTYTIPRGTRPRSDGNSRYPTRMMPEEVQRAARNLIALASVARRG